MSKNFFWVLGGAFLVGFLFTLSILFYFLKVSKGPDRLNFLFLGESNPEQVGATLTDSLIFVSFEKRGTVLVAVPRDLWYQPWQTKINALYYWSQEKGMGLAGTKEIIGEILGQKIDRAVVIDFAVFKDLVDLVDGVDIEVERAFVDSRFPIAGKENDLCGGDSQYACRYEEIRFEAGRQHLNGEQALKFVRSRNAEGEEGTDTARSLRQQKVLLALEKEFSSPSFYLDSGKIVRLWEIFQKRIRSDLFQQDFFLLGRILLSPGGRTFQSFVIDSWEKEEGLIYHPKKHPSGQWVLLPKDQSWEEIHRFIACLLNESDKSACLVKSKPPAQSD